MSKPLQWKLFIRKRASATQGVPPGKDDLKWVANTTTLIHGEHEALLVDTFLSDAQTAELANWIATPIHDLHYPWASRSFLRLKPTARSLSVGPCACLAAGGREDAKNPRTELR